ncbi:MAG TPA: DUF5336 domain-containing protein [Pseudonocardiaceae bacterium]|jgi:hypothetical protein|nr:DUF5336 domain-containing protein [Pseudonocardiaceae bacterium]
MSYPSGTPGGPPNQATQHVPPVFGQAPRRPGPLDTFGLPGLLCGVVAVLALVSYFCSFTADAAGLDLQVMILLAGGLLAALDLLPKAPDTLPFAALLSTVGGLSVLAAVIQGGGANALDVIILIFGLLQFGVSVFALLLDHGVVKMVPKSAVPYQPPQSNYAQQSPGSAQFPQQPGNGPTQHVQQPFPPAGGQQPGGAPQQPQSTQFLQQPGQLSQQQPGTPPGGFGGSNQG